MLAGRPVALAAIALCVLPLEAAANIDPAGRGARYAWAENLGWINLKPAWGPGVTVTDTAVLGLAWSENAGWIRFDPATGGGVTNDGTGALAGFAWGENVGWLNFAPSAGGVTINACGEVHGEAWGENVGWIRFRSQKPGGFAVTTDWISPVDDVAPVSELTSPLAAWEAGTPTLTFEATDCGVGVQEIVYVLDGAPAVVIPGDSLTLQVSGEGIHQLAVYARDADGNVEPVTRIEVRIDETPPVVTITSPASGAVIPINSPLPASFTATDALSGIAHVTAPVPDGALVDTTAAGPAVFTVTASDAAGNTTIASHGYEIVFPGNIDPAGHGAHYAWAENLGWVNLKPAWGPGVTVTDTAVTGLAWSENAGWIRFDPATGDGVSNDGTGILAGFAWGENVGWINFAPSPGGVVIHPGTGEWSGEAWGENVGWVRFGATGATPFAAVTGWYSTEDLDGDGLDGDAERAAGTDALDPDTDGDGLLDGDEVNGHGTDPLDADTDDDALADGKEVALGTDPLEPDSDHDGIADGDEVDVYGTDPLSADDAPIDVASGSIRVGKKGLLPVIFFGTQIFDVTRVDVETLALGPGAAPVVHAGGHVDDVDGDGFDDLVTHFRASETGLSAGDTEICLTGALLDGTRFTICDTIRTVGSRR